jgi:hypothetical protein
MTSPRTITLFEEHSDLNHSRLSYAASILIHSALIALVAFAILYTPRIAHVTVSNRYTLRQLDLHTPDQQVRRSSASQIDYPGPRSKTPSQATGGRQTEQAVVLPRIPHVQLAKQTLIQPELRTDLTLQQITPVAQVVLWTPADKPVVKIVAPQPARPPAASVIPHLQQPNRETNLADIALSAATQPSLKQLTVPSTTTPIVVREPQPTPTPPATVSQPAAKPTPAAVVSLSDVRMKNGTVTLPPVNETTASDAAGAFSLAPGEAKTPTAAGNGNPANKAPGNGQATAKNNVGQSANPHPGNEAASTATGSGSGASSPVNGAGPTPGLQAQGGNTGADQGNQISATQISLPKNGQFGAVIVGASLQDQFPEINDVWKGRMAYTVYLHVGMAKSWILQYSLPRGADISEAGATGHLEAPWPYNIVRPNLQPDSIDADAVMVHGYVNNAGQFETLNVVFPPQFQLARFILDSLQRWQFRPAMLNGQVARVEVLIIIPQEFE